MGDEQLRQLTEKIKERRIYLELIFSRNGRPLLTEAGLISLQLAIHILATRFLQRPEWPGHDVSEQVRRGWELQWYFQCLESVQSISQAIQRAIRDGAIIPRNHLTRARYVGRDLDQWLDINIPAAMQQANSELIAKANSELLAGAMPIDLLEIAWPDSVALPPSLGVIPEELARWCETEGIAAADEVTALFVEPAPAPAEEVAAPLGEQEPAKGRVRSDALTIELEQVCRALKQDGTRIDAEIVWAELSSRAGRQDSCIYDTRPGGIIWTRSSGQQATLTKNALAKRLQRIER